MKNSSDCHVSAEADLDEKELSAARDYALRRLNFAACSSATLRKGMLDRDISAPVADYIIARFTDLQLLDDEEYARMVARTKLKESHHGRRAIALDLRRKGIPDGVAARALEDISDDDEWEAARAHITKKLPSMLRLADQVAVRRLVGQLGRRGFAPGRAYELVRSMLRDARQDASDSPHAADS